MSKEYLEALEIECGELVEMDLLFLDRNGENQEKWRNSEAFKKAVEFEKKYGKSHTYILKSALQRLESIDNANHSEAMKCLDLLGDFEWRNIKLFKDCFPDLFDSIKQSLLKAQEQEKENEALKEIIKSLFDRGSPLHQYIDKDFGLTIEVDKGISIMHLGEFEGIDLDKKLKEILHNEQ